VANLTARQKRLLKILAVGVPLLAISPAEARRLWHFERGEPGFEQASATLPCGYPGPQKPASEWGDGWVIYCRGCKQYWTDDGIGFGDGECACTCTDSTAPHFEDWVIGAG